MTKETMQSPTSQNQTEEEKNMGQKPRKPYDGSYSHGVVADTDHVKTYSDYEKSLNRVNTRRQYLIHEYRKVQNKYENTEDVSTRADLLKQKARMEAQINQVSKVRSALEQLEGKIREKEIADQQNVQFMSFED